MGGQVIRALQGIGALLLLVLVGPARALAVTGDRAHPVESRRAEGTSAPIVAGAIIVALRIAPS